MEGTGHRSRIKALLALHGIKSDLRANWGGQIEGLRDYRGAALRAFTQAELKREWERLQLVERQIKEIEKEQNTLEEAKVKEAQEKNIPLRKIAPSIAKIEQLRQLKGIDRSARTLTYEFFGWRTFKNGREVGGAAGMTPTPFSSGRTDREQGISKAGNRRIRGIMVELAWSWERYQPESELTKWFQRKFGKQGKRRRRIGIVALARKLLVALWRYLETGTIPAGAVLKELEEKPAA
jgi:transposase